jgi:phosphatidyl-myo-inositol alpha-mannosyltransferase
MRILYVCPYHWDRPGGVRTHILDLAQTLIDVGDTCAVIAPSLTKTALPVGWKQLSVHLPESLDAGGYLYTIESKRTYRFGGTQIDVATATAQQMEHIRSLIVSFQPDIIHFHTPWSPFLSLQLLHECMQMSQAALISPKYVATFHDTPSDSALGRLIGRYLMPLAARYLMRCFDQVIAVSEPQSNYLTRFTTQLVEIIPNGIRLPEYVRSHDLLESMPKRYLLFLGRLEARKGVIHALDAFHQVTAKHPDLMMVVAGDGPQRIEAENMGRNRIPGKVLFLGQVTEMQKWSLLHRAEIVVCPALYGESFGIVLLEAMAAGAPVVGYGNPGYRSIVRGVFDDHFPNPGDIAGLTHAIDTILSDAAYKKECSQDGLTLADRFTWNRVAGRLRHLYSELSA